MQGGVGWDCVKPLIFFGTALVLFCSTSATPIAAPTVAKTDNSAPRPHHRLSPDQALSLYSPHARRLVQTYLRLRLLERREADLDRVRDVIERRVGVESLFGETPRPCAR